MINKKKMPLTEAEMREVGAEYHAKLKEKNLTNKQIREKLGIGWDKITFKQDSQDGMIHKGDVYVDKGYFYRHGMTPDSLIDRVLKIFPEAKIVDSGDHFGNWPARSYMFVIFRLERG